MKVKIDAWTITKTLFCIVVIALMVFGLYDCKRENKAKAQKASQQMEILLGGEHELHKIAPEKIVDSQWSMGGGFFMFVGGFSGSGSSVTNFKVLFSFKMHDGLYANCELPREKIFIRIDNSLKVPTMSFSWHDPQGSFFERHEIQGVMEQKVKLAIITCREDQWPVDIKMP